MTAKLFETALGITSPWYINGVEFDAGYRAITAALDWMTDFISHLARRSHGL
jgi:hypothetical protein